MRGKRKNTYIHTKYKRGMAEREEARGVGGRERESYKRFLERHDGT